MMRTLSSSRQDELSGYEALPYLPALTTSSSTPDAPKDSPTSKEEVPPESAEEPRKTKSGRADDRRVVTAGGDASSLLVAGTAIGGLYFLFTFTERYFSS